MPLIDELKEKAEPYAAPIAGDSPAGADISYDAEFDSIKNEIDKLSSMSGDQPDWGKVVSVGDSLTKDKAKDLRVLAWWTLGKLKQNSVRGLAEGLVTMTTVCAAHWDVMHPPARRAKARSNLATWLSEQAATFLENYEPKASEKEVFETLQTVQGDLDELLSEKLADAYDGMGNLRSLVREMVRRVPAEAPKPEPAKPASAAAPSGGAAPAAAAAAAPAATMAAPSLGSVSDVAEVTPVLREVSKTLVQVGSVLRGANPAEARSYRLTRLGAWLLVAGAPPNENGATRIPAPPADVRKKLDGLASAGQWMDLLKAAEELTSRFIFWFDVQRFVAVAMDNLGALFIDARETMGREVVGLVKLHPMLPKLTFADGTPFADSSAQSWLDEEAAKHGGGGGGGGPVDEEAAELAERFQAANKLVTTGKVADGLALAALLASRGVDARSRFRSRLGVAKMALAGGKPDIARSMLDGLFQEAERMGLEDWEPALCSQLYGLLLASRKGVPEAKLEQGAPSNLHILGRLSRLDPAGALKFESP